MISFKRAYVATINGKEEVFATLKEAQAAELATLFPVEKDSPTWEQQEIANQILAQSEAILNILTLNDASRPRARGQKKPRRKAQDEQLPLVKENAA